MTSTPRRLVDFDAVFLDAGFTLLEPVLPVAQIYAEEARAVGADVELAAMQAAVAAAWNGGSRQATTPDLRSSEELERAAWSALTRDAAAPFPALTERHAVWLERLFLRFDRPATWRPVEGALDLLDALRGRGKAVGVVSNWHSALHGIAEAHGIASRVDWILTSAAAGRRKPHPDIFLQAMARTGIPANRTAHVGDSETDDVTGALEAGLTPFLLSTRPSTSPGVASRPFLSMFLESTD